MTGSSHSIVGRIAQHFPRGCAVIRIPFRDFDAVERSAVSSAAGRRVAEIRERHMARSGEFFGGAERPAIICPQLG